MGREIQFEEVRKVDILDIHDENVFLYTDCEVTELREGMIFAWYISPPEQLCEFHPPNTKERGMWRKTDCDKIFIKE